MVKNLRFYLSEIYIKNFLSFDEGNFTYLRSYNVLIGKNNSGKSNFVRIINTLSDLAKGQAFNKNYLFDGNIEKRPVVTLKFELSLELRRKFFEVLFDGNYLDMIIQTHGNESRYLRETKWKEKNGAITWLSNKGIINSIKIQIVYLKETNNFCIEQIKVIHDDLENEQVVYQLRTSISPFEAFAHDIQMSTKMSQNLENFFSSSDLKRTDNVMLSSIYDLIRRSSFGDVSKQYPLLPLMVSEVLSSFLNSIYVIPHDRRFEGELSVVDPATVNLELNGLNFVHYIYKLLNTDSKELWDDINIELKDYFPKLEELTQIVESGNRSTIIAKEQELSMKLKLENFGTGILNIAFFLTWLKIIGEKKFLFIEEPELFIYSGLQKKLLAKFLSVSDRIQIFITTHSYTFLSTQENLCSVYYIQKNQNRSIVYKVPQGEFSVIKTKLDIILEEYEEDQNMIYNDSFWIKFVNYVINKDEDQLWDFKQQLDWWNPECKNKEKSQVKFCNHIASFANAQGGVLLIGITDIIPRKIVGVEKREERTNSTLRLLKKLTNLEDTCISIRPINLKDTTGEERICWVIIIPQTREVIEVKNIDGSRYYPVRLGSGMDYSNYNETKKRKEDVKINNVKFIDNLIKLVNPMK